MELSQALQSGLMCAQVAELQLLASLYEVATTANLNLASAERFLSAVQNFPSPITFRHFSGEKRALRTDGDPHDLEGLLAADTYFLDSESTLADFLEVSSKRFHTMWSNLRSKARRLRKSVMPHWPLGIMSC